MAVRRIVVALLAALVIAGSGGGLAAPVRPDPEAAKKVIRDGVAAAIEILRSHHLPRKEINKRLRDSLSGSFDIATIAKYALGMHSRRVTEEQLNEYINAFEELIVETYTSRIIIYGPRIKGNIDNVIKVTDTVPVGDTDLVVRSQINRKNAEWVKIDWRLHQQNGRPQIIDVVILGVSQAVLYRQEFMSVMRRRGRGVDGLIAALREKNAMLRAE